VARRHVQLEDITAEYTVRGLNYKIDMSGITSRYAFFISLVISN
jgi:hypothetical protein